jgi:ATP-dependent helicase Lhr and Lhr-like helicase
VAGFEVLIDSDTGDASRKQFLADPADVLMTTPESLEVMLISPRVDTAALFGDLRWVIVDEVHALAGTDRGAHLLSVIERLAAVSRHDVQRVGLSATVGNPADILAWLTGTSARSGAVIDPPKQPSRRQIRVISRPGLEEVAREAAGMAAGGKSLFFCQSRATSEAVTEFMRRAGTEVFVHHSAVSREERQLAEERFHHGTDACIVCTSTLELGIDVGDLDRVLQAEAPTTVGSFLQRMGRTGRRAGQAANTTFLCETAEGVLQAVALVELAKSGWVESVEVSDRCWPVLIHQLLALSLADAGVTAEDAWGHLSRVRDFAGISREEYDRLIAWLLENDWFRMASGRLVLGPQAERRFGRRNFMELYAVFSSPQSYAVETGGGQALGTLNQDFVDRLVDGVSTFLLSGRAWLVRMIRHDDRRVVVEPAPRGRQPTWGGFLPQFLGFDLCQRIRNLLAGEEPYAYLDEHAAAVLAEQRAILGPVLRGHRGDLEIIDGEYRWWTFAGGRINSTLRHALIAGAGDWRVTTDNFTVRIQGDALNGEAFEAALARLRQEDLWQDEQLWAGIAAGLPGYRLSKFQPLMPPWVEREVISRYLLDVPGARQWLDMSPTP